MSAQIIDNKVDAMEPCCGVPSMPIGIQGRVPSEVNLFHCADSGARPVSPLPMDPSLVVCEALQPQHQHRLHFSQLKKPSPRFLDERQGFLVFVKIAMLYLTRRKQMQLRCQVRVLVNHCTAQNRLDNPRYKPLRPVLQSKLRQLLGDHQWKEIEYLWKAYCNCRHLVVAPERDD